MGDYRLGKHLGAGSYASVKQAVHRATGLLTAIKIYDKAKLTSEAHKRNISQEIATLKKLLH
jgi:serine/threonine protein kinase